MSNLTGRPKAGLIAHLNVLSTDPSTYVDPEDWSSHRTQFIDALPAHGERTLSWPMQAVNSGSLVVYVAVIDPADRSTTVSAPIDLSVAKQQTIDAGGILPLALGVPGGVAVLLTVSRLHRRRVRLRQTTSITANGRTSSVASRY